VVEASVVDGHAAFDYVPGLLAFREIPAMVTAPVRLTVTPDLLVCDGPPGRQRGAWSPLAQDGEVVGRVLRTRNGVKSVFVSTGHRVPLDLACAMVLRLCTRYRLPETTRRADHLFPEPARATGGQIGRLQPVQVRAAAQEPALIGHLRLVFDHRQAVRRERIRGVVRGIAGAVVSAGLAASGSGVDAMDGECHLGDGDPITNLMGGVG
jgi:hypothetical protein